MPWPACAPPERPPASRQPEELGTIQALQARLHTVGKFDLVFLAIAVLFMATSRYLG
jgi:hypothetical protein